MPYELEMHSMDILKKVAGDVLAVVFFLIVGFAYFMTPISEGLVAGGHDAVASVGQGREGVAYKQRTGETSRWTNTLFCGMPTYQIAPSYKASGILAKIEGIYSLGTPQIMSYVFLFLLGFYILLRAFDFRPWLAVLGAVLWAFSSYFFIIVSAGHIWKVMTLAFIPPTIAGLVWAYRGKYLLGGVITALFTALQVYSNHVQMTYYFLFLMLFLVIAYAEESLRAHRFAHFGKATLAVVLGGLLGVAANLPSLYHTYEYSKLSLRGAAELTPPKAQAAQATGDGLDRDYITQWSYGIGETLTLLIPDFKGGGSSSILDNETAQNSEAFPTFYQYAGQAQQVLQQQGVQAAPPGVNLYWGDQPFTVGPVYVGALVCLLFMLGLFVVRGPVKWALVAGTILSFLFAWGHHSPTFTNWLIDYLPMYNKFRTPSSALVVAEFTMPLLAILALARLLREPQTVFATKTARIGLGVSLVCTLGIALLFALVPSVAGDTLSKADAESLQALLPVLSPQGVTAYSDAISQMHHDILSASAWRTVGFLVISILTIGFYWFTQRKAKAPSKAMAATVCVILTFSTLFDLWGINKRYLNDENFTDPMVLQNPQPTSANKKVLEDKSDYRVLNVAGGNPFNETSNITAYFHQSIGGYNAAKLHRYQDLIDHQLLKELPLLMQAVNEVQGDMTRVNLDTVAPITNMLNTKYFIFGERAEQVVQNPYANGNAWFVSELAFVKNADEEMAALTGLDTKKKAVADVRFQKLLDGGTRGTGTAKLLSRDANKVSYEAETNAGGILVMSEVYYPGWDVTIDGKAAEVARVNYILRAIKVPAGKHRIDLVYEPASIATTETMAYIALAFIFLGALVVGISQWKKKK